MLKAVEVVSHEKLLWRFLNHCNIFPDFPALSNLLPAWLQICQNAGPKQKFWFHQVCSSMADMDDMGDSLRYRYQIPVALATKCSNRRYHPSSQPPSFGSMVWHSLSHSLWLWLWSVMQAHLRKASLVCSSIPGEEHCWFSVHKGRRWMCTRLARAGRWVGGRYY